MHTVKPVHTLLSNMKYDPNTLRKRGVFVLFSRQPFLIHMAETSASDLLTLPKLVSQIRMPYNLVFLPMLDFLQGQ